MRGEIRVTYKVVLFVDGNGHVEAETHDWAQARIFALQALAPKGDRVEVIQVIEQVVEDFG
jgi:TolB-like protein